MGLREMLSSCLGTRRAVRAVAAAASGGPRGTLQAARVLLGGEGSGISLHEVWDRLLCNKQRLDYIYSYKK